MQPEGATVTAHRPPTDQLTAGNPNNPFVCNLCKKTYSRLDHLGRHYRSRDLTPPLMRPRPRADR